VGVLVWSITTRWSVQTGVQFPKHKVRWSFEEPITNCPQYWHADQVDTADDKTVQTATRQCVHINSKDSFRLT